jgi:hypothetical protein
MAPSLRHTRETESLRTRKEIARAQQRESLLRAEQERYERRVVLWASVAVAILLAVGAAIGLALGHIVAGLGVLGGGGGLAWWAVVWTRGVRPREPR